MFNIGGENTTNQKHRFLYVVLYFLFLVQNYVCMYMLHINMSESFMYTIYIHFTNISVHILG